MDKSWTVEEGAEHVEGGCRRKEIINGWLKKKGEQILLSKSLGGLCTELLRESATQAKGGDKVTLRHLSVLWMWGWSGSQCNYIAS